MTDKTLRKRRIPISKTSQNRIEGWRKQLHLKVPGIKITDSDFVNWAVSTISETLSKKQESELKENFFDEDTPVKTPLVEEVAVSEEEAMKESVELTPTMSAYTNMLNRISTSDKNKVR